MLLYRYEERERRLEPQWERSLGRTPIDQVALPILQFSSVLTDADLVEIVARADEAKQTAVASRETVSDNVSAAIVEHGGAGAVSTLVGNKGAELSEVTLGQAIERHGENTQISDQVALRPDLPVGIAERLVTIVSEKMRDHLIQNHAMPSEAVSDLVNLHEMLDDRTDEA